MDFGEWCFRRGIRPQLEEEYRYLQMAWREEQNVRNPRTRSPYEREERELRYRQEYQMWPEPAMSQRQVEPKDEKLEKYRSRKLKEYASPKFRTDDELLPKEMVPHTVMLPKEDIKSRVAAYLV